MYKAESDVAPWNLKNDEVSGKWLLRFQGQNQPQTFHMKN